MVCHLWHQLSLSIITSLDVKITTEEAAEQLSLWMKNHGATVTNMQLHLTSAVCQTRAGRSLLQSFGQAVQLRSLHICSDSRLGLLDTPLSPLSNLRSLSITSTSLAEPVVSSILSLSILDTLRLSNVDVQVPGDHVYTPWDSPLFVQQIAMRLVQLTSLADLRLAVVGIDGLAHLHSLPQLKRLTLRGATGASSLGKLRELPITSIDVTATPETLIHVSSWLNDAGRHLTLRNQVHFGSLLPAASLPLHSAANLKSLTMRRVQLDISQLTTLTQLNSLVLDDCGLNDGNVHSMSGLSGLRSLDLSYNPDVTGAQGTMDVLARSMPHLTSLRLLGTAAEEAAERAFQGRIVFEDQWLNLKH